jgi:hypothetical protein
MPNYKHQSGECHRQQGARQLVDLDHLSSPNQRFYVGRTLFRSIEFRPIRTKRVTQSSRKSFDFTGYWQPGS